MCGCRRMAVGEWADRDRWVFVWMSQMMDVGGVRHVLGLMHGSISMGVHELGRQVRSCGHMGTGGWV